MARGAREAAIRMGIDQRYLRASIGSTERTLQRFGGKVTADLNRTFRGAFGGFGGIAGVLGIGALAAEAKKLMDFETRVVRLGIASRSSAQRMAQLKTQIFAVGQARGLDPNALLGGVEKFVALTGDIEAAAKALDAFGMVASATGSNVQDITVAAAALSTNLGVSGDLMKDAFAGLVAQGKAGAVELKDMAAELAGLTPQFATFNKVGVEGLRELGALLQLARQGFGSAAETATGMTSLMTKLVKNARQLKAVGVNVFETGPNGEKRLRNMADIIFELGDKTQGDPAKLMKAIGDIEAYKALLPILKEGRAEFEKLVAVAAGGSRELDADFARIAETPAFKIEQAKAQLQRVFDEQLVRVLPIVASAMEKIAAAVEWLAKHSTEAAALFIALKGGGWLGGLAGTLGGGAAGALAGGGRGGALGNLAMTAAGWAVGGGGRGGVGAAGPTRGQRLLGMGGNMLQGAGIGYALTSLSPHGVSSLEAVTSTVAGALAALPGPVGMAAKAALGLKAAFDLASSSIDRKENQRAARTLDEFFLDRGKDMGLHVSPGSRTGGVWFDPNVDPEKARSGARSILTEGMTQGFITRDGTDGFKMDREAMKKFVLSQKGWSGAKMAAAETMFSHAFAMMTGAGPIDGDAGLQSWAHGRMAPVVFGQDTGGAVNPSLTADQAMAAGQAAGKVLIQIGVAPGFIAEVLNNDPSIRTSGGGR
jgi:hypothetical protein